MTENLGVEWCEVYRFKVDLAHYANICQMALDAATESSRYADCVHLIHVFRPTAMFWWSDSSNLLQKGSHEVCITLP